MTNNIAINELEINKIIMDLDDYAINARKIFSQIESVVNSLNRDCDAKIMSSYVNKFKTFSNNFSIMSNNILSYKSDLQDVKNRFKEQQSIASKVVNEQTKNIMNRR